MTAPWRGALGARSFACRSRSVALARAAASSLSSRGRFGAGPSENLLCRLGLPSALAAGDRASREKPLFLRAGGGPRGGGEKPLFLSAFGSAAVTCVCCPDAQSTWESSFEGLSQAEARLAHAAAGDTCDVLAQTACFPASGRLNIGLFVKLALEC